MIFRFIERKLKDLFFALIYPNGVPFIIQEQKIRLHRSLRRWNVYAEESLQKALVKYLQAGDIFIDIGANFGIHSLLAAKLVGPTGKIYAFEPVPVNLDLLMKNIKLNKLQNMEVLPCAVSNSNKQYVEMYIPGEEVAITASLHSCMERVVSIEVQNVRLDDWVAFNMYPKLIKIDVEGAELEVLKGAGSLLQRCHPILLIEVHGYVLSDFGASISELQKYLEDHDYRREYLSGEQFHNEKYFQAIYTFNN